jgi:predicted transport protein
VIIEYKRNKNDNVINQALSYLKWLKAQKLEFFQMLMQQKLGKAVADSITLDWKNPRVICIAESYSKFDIDTVEVVPLRIELYKYRFYEGDVFSLEPVNVEEKNEAVLVKIDAAKAEVDTTSIEDLRSKGSELIRHLFDSLDERIRLLDETITARATSFYVAYRLGNNFADVQIGKNQIKIHMRPADFDDPKGLIEKIPDGYNRTLTAFEELENLKELAVPCSHMLLGKFQRPTSNFLKIFYKNFTHLLALHPLPPT